MTAKDIYRAYLAWQAEPLPMVAAERYSFLRRYGIVPLISANGHLEDEIETMTAELTALCERDDIQVVRMWDPVIFGDIANVVPVLEIVPADSVRAPSQ